MFFHRLAFFLTMLLLFSMIILINSFVHDAREIDNVFNESRPEIKSNGNIMSILIKNNELINSMSKTINKLKIESGLQMNQIQHLIQSNMNEKIIDQMKQIQTEVHTFTNNVKKMNRENLISIQELLLRISVQNKENSEKLWNAYLNKLSVEFESLKKKNESDLEGVKQLIDEKLGDINLMDRAVVENIMNVFNQIRSLVSENYHYIKDLKSLISHMRESDFFNQQKESKEFHKEILQKLHALEEQIVTKIENVKDKLVRKIADDKNRGDENVRQIIEKVSEILYMNEKKLDVMITKMNKNFSQNLEKLDRIEKFIVTFIEENNVNLTTLFEKIKTFINDKIDLHTTNQQMTESEKKTFFLLKLYIIFFNLVKEHKNTNLQLTNMNDKINTFEWEYKGNVFMIKNNIVDSFIKNYKDQIQNGSIRTDSNENRFKHLEQLQAKAFEKFKNISYNISLIIEQSESKYRELIEDLKEEISDEEVKSKFDKIIQSNKDASVLTKEKEDSEKFKKWREEVEKHFNNEFESLKHFNEVNFIQIWDKLVENQKTNQNNISKIHAEIENFVETAGSHLNSELIKMKTYISNEIEKEQTKEQIDKLIESEKINLAVNTEKEIAFIAEKNNIYYSTTIEKLFPDSELIHKDIRWSKALKKFFCYNRFDIDMKVKIYQINSQTGIPENDTQIEVKFVTSDETLDYRVHNGEEFTFKIDKNKMQVFSINFKKQRSKVHFIGILKFEYANLIVSDQNLKFQVDSDFYVGEKTFFYMAPFESGKYPRISKQISIIDKMTGNSNDELKIIPYFVFQKSFGGFKNYQTSRDIFVELMIMEEIEGTRDPHHYYRFNNNIFLNYLYTNKGSSEITHQPSKEIKIGERTTFVHYKNRNMIRIIITAEKPLIGWVRFRREK